MRDGGFSTLPVLTMVQRPMEMAVCAEGFSFEAPPAALEGFRDEELVLLGWGRVACRSPRRCTSDIITVRPPRVMFAVPVMALRRETLLPESLVVLD
jgi:hypothetical protein